VQWKPPPAGCVKLNFDGSVYNDGSRRASIGGVIRDCTGRVLAAFAETTEHATVGIVEARALIRGLQLALKYSYNFLGGLVVEGDDRDLARLLRREDTYTRIPAAMEEEIIRLLGHFPAYLQVDHIYREGNQVADALCHEAYRQQQPREWTAGDILPHAVNEKARDDAYNLAHNMAHVRICKPKPPRYDTSIRSWVS
jgi:ribonuclease HI